jgi:hypothetical protein
MARDAASGSVRIRGGQDHKGVEFQARSTFMFSGINPPGIPPASLSRLAIIQLGKLPRGKPPQLDRVDTIGPRLLRRCADHLPDFERLLVQYSDVLAENGHNARGQATFGTFLAAAHMLLGDEGMDALRLPFETLDWWGMQLSADAVPEISEIAPPWQQFMDLLWKSPIDIREHGETRTVGQMLQRLRDEPDDARIVERYLAAHDLALIDRRIDGLGWWLAVPNSSKVIGRAMADTPFAARGGDGNWRFALGGGPPEFIIKELAAGVGSKTKADNRYRVAGTQVRCLFIYLDGYRDWQERQ